MQISSDSAGSHSFSQFLRDPQHRADLFQWATRLSRPIDADDLRGRHEGRARAPRADPAKPLSSLLQARVGSTRGLAARALRSVGRSDDTRQRAIVKVHYFGHGGGGASALRAHARYVARDGAGRLEETAARHPEAERGDAPAQTPDASRPPRRGVFYDLSGDDVDGTQRVATWARQDRRHFRIILAPENGARLGDLRDYARAVMAAAESALGSRLEWVAVDHWDTGYPHTHIILRGRRDDGRDLVLPRAFVSHGFRNAARDVATARLGTRTRDDARVALRNEVLAHRPTRLDKMIAAQLPDDRTIRLSDLRAPHRAPELAEALKSRARELSRLGLARETRRNVLAFEPDWMQRLQAMERHLDIRRTVVRARAQSIGDPLRASARGKGSPGKSVGDER